MATRSSLRRPPRPLRSPRRSRRRWKGRRSLWGAKSGGDCGDRRTALRAASLGLFPPLPDDGRLRRLLGDNGAATERDFAGRAVEGDPVALADWPAVQCRPALTLGDDEPAAAYEADLAHLPRHHRRMSGAPADRRQNSVGDGEARDVLGRSFAPDEDRGVP